MGPEGNSAERAMGHKSPGSKDDYNKQQNMKQIKEVIFASLVSIPEAKNGYCIWFWDFSTRKTVINWTELRERHKDLQGLEDLYSLHSDN